MIFKIIFLAVFHFLRIFEEKNRIFLKSMTKIAPFTQATWSKKSSVSEFSHAQNIFLCVGKLPKIQVI